MGTLGVVSVSGERRPGRGGGGAERAGGKVREGVVFWFMFEEGLVWNVGFGMEIGWIWGEGHTYRQTRFARVVFHEYAEQVPPAFLFLRCDEDGVPVVEGWGLGRWEEGKDGGEGGEESDGFRPGGRWRGLGGLGHSRC